MKNFILVGLIFSVLFFAGCVVPPAGKTGKLNLSITDRQVEGLEELNLTISSIEIHKALADSNNDSNKESADSWILFSSEEQTFDLMKLKSSDGLKALLGEKELDAGKYTQIRLQIKEVKAKINGEIVVVVVPSEKLKLARNFEIKENQTTELIIDFSPESVIKSGDTYKLKPVIKILSTKEFGEKKIQRMTKEKAMEIAQASECAMQGTLKQKAEYNENTKTWWIEFEPNEPKEDCNPTCVVSEETKTAEINWRCTGLIIPELMCSTDSDCACGTKKDTRECFYGNKEFVNIEEQCPDFCSGIAGNFEIKCISNKCTQINKAFYCKKNSDCSACSNSECANKDFNSTAYCPGNRCGTYIKECKCTDNKCTAITGNYFDDRGTEKPKC
jgi:hypothetical protein